MLCLLMATVGLALGLYYTVPCSRKLAACDPARLAANKTCWGDYWVCTAGAGGRAKGLYFFMAVAGAACLVLSLLFCCGFCCMKSPSKKAALKAKKQQQQDQFITGNTAAGTSTDAAPAAYSDQYAAYDTYPNVKQSSVAHV